MKNPKLALLILFPPTLALEFQNCLIRENVAYNSLSPTFTFRNCSENSYCCDEGCCSLLWYTGPLAIFFVVIFLCCLTCLKACWDVYHENVTTVHNRRANGRSVRFQTATNDVQVFTSPPPAYNVAVFLPQPSTRVPSYEEVMSQ